MCTHMTHGAHAGMDGDNMRAIKTAAEYWRSNGSEIPDSYPEKARNYALKP